MRAASAASSPAFCSRPATRAVRSSMADALICGALGAGGTAGQPSIQPTAITSVAATAPEVGAITQGEIEEGETEGETEGEIAAAGAAAGSPDDALADELLSGELWSGELCGACSGAAPPAAFLVSLTSLASRSMVGGARLTRLGSG